MSLGRTLAKEFTSYSLSYLFMQLVTVALAVFIRNVLGPEAMGVWVSLQVVLAYTKYSNFGLGGAAAREIPYAKGQQKQGQAEHIRNASYTFTLVMAALLSLGILAAAFLVKDRFSGLVFYSLLTLAALSFFQRASTFCVTILRAEKRFDFINRYNVYSALLNAVLTVMLILSFGLYGYYASMLLSFLFNWAYVLYGSGVSFRLDWRWKELGPLFKLGLGLIVMNMLYTFVSSVDKIAISTFLGLQPLGLYSLAILMSGLVASFPNNLGVVVFPYLNEAYGAASDKVRKLVVLPTRFMAIYMPFGIALLWLAAPYLVPVFLPKYEGGIEAAKIGMFATLFMILGNNMSDALITFKKYFWSIPAQGLIGGAILAADFFWIRSGAGIREVAWSMLAGFMLLYGLYAAIALRSVNPAGGAVREITRVLACPCATLAALLTADRLWPGQNPAAFFGRVFFVMLSAAPFAAWGEKQFRVLTRITEWLRQSPGIGRLLFYRDAKSYWQKRGGERYFQEQESRADRTETSRFLAKELASLGAETILEVGCGYGKNLKELRALTGAELWGLDFSASQLEKAKGYLAGFEKIRLLQGDAGRLPFADHSMDVVFTSNVILHNPPDQARRIRREILRVAKKYVVHKEDTDTNFSRFGYDHAQIYRDLGYAVIRSQKLPMATDSDVTQFVVIELNKKIKA